MQKKISSEQLISLMCKFCNRFFSSEKNEYKHKSLIKLLILEEKFKRLLEPFASELFICSKLHATQIN